MALRTVGMGPFDRTTVGQGAGRGKELNDAASRKPKQPRETMMEMKMVNANDRMIRTLAKRSCPFPRRGCYPLGSSVCVHVTVVYLCRRQCCSCECRTFGGNNIALLGVSVCLCSSTVVGICLKLHQGADATRAVVKIFPDENMPTSPTQRSPTDQQRCVQSRFTP